MGKGDKMREQKGGEMELKGAMVGTHKGEGKGYLKWMWVVERSSSERV